MYKRQLIKIKRQMIFYVHIQAFQLFLKITKDWDKSRKGKRFGVFFLNMHKQHYIYCYSVDAEKKDILEIKCSKM